MTKTTLIKKVKTAKHAEDIFGDEADVKSNYREFAKLLHPDIDLSPHNQDLMEQERHLTEPLSGNVRQDRTTVDASEVLDLIEATMNSTILMTSEGAAPSHKKFNEKPNILPQPHSHHRRDGNARSKA